ncbi:Transcription elongation factor [Macleaya cordata]|uniref:Transcription elongation factor n=1 Tax=Macleaya cordata TaxID=56857 RepID=A0A200PYQ6_MACCD|nr:Transcription elongation factor [Macleaya cordata]
MDVDEFRSILRKSGVDLWTFIDTAISVASFDYRDELKDRRDGIVEKLYTPGFSSSCRNCNHESPRHSNEIKEKDSSSHEGKGGSPSTPQSIDGDADDYQERIFGRSIDEEQTKILAIKEHLEEPDQSEDSLVNLLQNLADMDITFKALKETDIGRHVNRLRKNPSNDVRRLVKQLVRKWKDLVDEWVKSNTPGETAASTLIDGDSPQQNQPKSNQNGHHQVPDFAYSPNPHNGSSGSDKYNSEPERKVKTVPRREPLPKPSPPVPSSSSAPNKQREQQKDNLMDPERLASARRRLHENYQEAQNAKKQRTIQVMDIHDIPKPKNSFFAKNKGGFQAKHW